MVWLPSGMQTTQRSCLIRGDVFRKLVGLEDDSSIIVIAGPTTGRSSLTSSNMNAVGSSCCVGLKVKGLDQRVSISIVITITLLALFPSISGEIPHVQGQTNTTLSNSTMMPDPTMASQSMSNTTASEAPSYSNALASASLSTTANSTSLTSDSNVTSNPIASDLASNNTTSGSTDFAPTYSWITVTTTSTTTSVATLEASTSSSGGYSITFSPTFWLCTDVSVTFTGPLVESGFYGDTLQFQYFQYNPSYPSILYPIFTDPSLTVTSDTVNYWISYSEYAQANFAYLPNVAVKVVDVTPKSNGYIPGLIFMELTNVTPESGPYCPYDSPAAAPEFVAAPVEWLVVMISIAMALVFFRVYKTRRFSESDGRVT